MIQDINEITEKIKKSIEYDEETGYFIIETGSGANFKVHRLAPIELLEILFKIIAKGNKRRK